MIGVSGQRDFRWTWLLLGLGAAAAATGGIATAVAEPATHLPRPAVLTVLAACVALGLADITGRRGLTFPRRQTWSGAAIYAGARLGQFLWGLDIGLGFTTYRTSRLYWAGLALLVLTGSPALCFAGACGYVLAFAIALRRGRYSFVGEEWMMRRRRRLGLAGTVVLVALLVVVGLG